MNKTIITALCIGTILISGCKENDIAYYGEESRLEFSTYISCAFNDQNYFDAFIADEKITNVDFPVKVNLIGQLLTGERTFWHPLFYQ